MKDYTIYDIEALTYTEASQLAEEKLTIKSHTVFLIDFKGYFGYSAVVFYGDAPIYHANDYQLHHRSMEKSELKEWYIETLNNKLFTDAEMSLPLTDYMDYKNKNYYLRNYYSQREFYISAFHIFKNEAEEKAYHESVKSMHFNPVSYGYYKDLTFVNTMVKMSATLEKRKAEIKNSYDYWYSAFRYEFSNYECYYAYEDKYAEVAEDLTDGKLNDVQKKAFHDAKRDYNNAMENSEY